MDIVEPDAARAARRSPDDHWLSAFTSGVEHHVMCWYSWVKACNVTRVTTLAYRATKFDMITCGE